MKRNLLAILIAGCVLTSAYAGLVGCRSGGDTDQKPVAGERSEMKDIETVHTSSAPGAQAGGGTTSRGDK